MKSPNLTDITFLSISILSIHYIQHLKLIGGPLDGQTIKVAQDETAYRAHKLVGFKDGLAVHQHHYYKMVDDGSFKWAGELEQ